MTTNRDYEESQEISKLSLVQAETFRDELLRNLGFRRISRRLWCWKSQNVR
jgi:hypothetical protein